MHVIMYFYYLLAALGVKGVFKWKKWMTRIQILQFVLILAYYLSTFVRGCKVDKIIAVVLAFNTITFLYLFIQFYYKTYNAKKVDEKKLKSNWLIKNFWLLYRQTGSFGTLLINFTLNFIMLLDKVIDNDID